jgi:ATP-dependent Clp protease ATP-binding subunit ClpC
MLEKDSLDRIVDLEVSKLAKRLEEKSVVLVLSPEARTLLATKGFDPAYGARPMRRAVERYLEDPLAEALLRGDVKPGDLVNVVPKPDSEDLQFNATHPDPEMGSVPAS